MIINNLHIKRISIPPHKTHSVLLIDANAMLPITISVKRLQSVSRWHLKVLERDGRVQNGEFYECPSLQISGKISAPPRSPKSFCVFIAETRNHLSMLTQYDTNALQY